MNFETFFEVKSLTLQLFYDHDAHLLDEGSSCRTDNNATANTAAHKNIKKNKR